MEEAERLCDRVGVIDDGRLIAEGTRRELIAQIGEHDRIVVRGDGHLAEFAERASPRGRCRRSDRRRSLGRGPADEAALGPGRASSHAPPTSACRSSRHRGARARPRVGLLAPHRQGTARSDRLSARHAAGAHASSCAGDSATGRRCSARSSARCCWPSCSASCSAGPARSSSTIGVVDLDGSDITSDLRHRPGRRARATPPTARSRSSPSTRRPRPAPLSTTDDLDAAIVMPGRVQRRGHVGPGRRRITVLRDPRNEVSAGVAASVAGQFAAGISSRTLAVATVDRAGRLDADQPTAGLDDRHGADGRHDEAPGGRDGRRRGVLRRVDVDPVPVLHRRLRRAQPHRRTQDRADARACWRRPRSTSSDRGRQGAGRVRAGARRVHDRLGRHRAGLRFVLGRSGRRRAGDGRPRCWPSAVSRCSSAASPRTEEQADGYTSAVAFALALLGGNFVGPGQAPEALQRARVVHAERPGDRRVHPDRRRPGRRGRRQPRSCCCWSPSPRSSARSAWA